MEELADIFMELVKIDSPSGNEDAVADCVLRMLGGRAEAKKDGYGNVYARGEGTGESIFISAHMDTVEPCRGIRPRIENGYLVSGGDTILGVDNKAALACAVLLARNLKDRASHRPLELVITRSEETGSYGAVNFDYSLLKAKEGICFDIARPIGTIISGSPFYERFDLAIEGKEAHASRPDTAVNALTAFAFLVRDIPFGNISTSATANIGMVRSGTARNTVPGRVAASGEVRSFSEKDLREYRERMEAALKRLEKEFGVRCSVEFVRENDGYEFESGGGPWRFIDLLSSKVRGMGLDARIERAWSVSDANIFNSKGLTCINLGNGAEDTHTIRERISLENLSMLYALMEAIIKV